MVRAVSEVAHPVRALIYNQDEAMRGPVPTLVLVILSLCVGWSSLNAQDDAKPDLQFNADSEFGEEIKQIEAASDREARRAAFSALLDKAREIEKTPEPLVSIIDNKKPEKVFSDLIAWIRDVEDARHDCFVRPLVLVANDAGDEADVAVDAVLGYGASSLETIRKLFEGGTEERLAAAQIAGERPGGTAGAVQLIPGLLSALDRNEPDLTRVAVRSLRRITLLELETAVEWREWLADKSNFEIAAEIADREAAARREAEASRDDAQRDYLEVQLKRMSEDEHDDAPALVAHLRESEHLAVRRRAIELLKDLLPELEGDAAKVAVDAIGEPLLDDTEPTALRIDAARALAKSGWGELAYPYFDRALRANGIGADLRLELVRGLNSPVAAGRLASMLAEEVDGVETRSSAVLKQLIAQVRGVMEVRDTSPARDAILKQLGRILQLVSTKLDGELEAPARERFVDLAVNTCDTLVHIARLRQVDISACVDALVELAAGENGSSAAALSALRQALSVAASRGELVERMTSPPINDRLTILYQRLMAAGPESEPRLVNLLALYRDMEVAPEPLDGLKERLLERARASEAVLPPNPGVQKTVRDALRALLAALLRSEEAHVRLVGDLVDAEHGLNDALGYLQVLVPPRVDVLTGALRPRLNGRALDIGRLVAQLEGGLTAEELDSETYRAFHDDLNRTVRDEFRKSIAGALEDGLKEDVTEKLTAAASGSLRRQFIPAAVEALKDNPAKSESRDTVSDILMTALRDAHPERYEGIELRGLERKEFLAQLDALDGRLRDDGYSVP